MKSYNLIVLLSLSVLFASISAQEIPKNSAVVENQINAGFDLCAKLIEFYKNRFIGIVYDGVLTKKDIFTYFKERINHRSASFLNIIDATDYQTFTTDIITGLDSVIDSTRYSFEELINYYDNTMFPLNSNTKTRIIEATESLRNIIDTNTTAYNCYVKHFKILFSNEFNLATTALKRIYKSSMASKIIANSAFVEAVKKVIVAIEKKIDYCIGSSNPAKCLNNYASFTGQSQIQIVRAYQPDVRTKIYSILEEATDGYSTHVESMLEILSDIEDFTKVCAKM